MYDERKIEQNIEGIIDENAVELPKQDIFDARQTLKEASTEELELLLSSRDIGLPQNQDMRDMVLELLTEQRGARYVADLLESLREVDASAWLKYVTSANLGGDNLTQAERAREELRRVNNPLAEIIPDGVVTFIMDDNGTFYLRLEQEETAHMADFDLRLAEEVSGIAEMDYTYALHGVTALAQVNGKLLEIDFQEIRANGEDITITTNHPIAKIVHLRRDDFIFAVLDTM